MELTWLGTAGFQIKTGKEVFLIDPYLSRNATARPRQPFAPEDLSETGHIFVSHGHFDHIFDIPAIASQTGCRVYCCPVTARTLRHNGIGGDLIHEVPEDHYPVALEGYRARAFFSQHVKFDRWLLIKTLARINFRIPRYLPLMKAYPVGQVLSWQFEIDGQILQHFGSAGSTAEELERLSRQKIDILFVPLQGHTRICDIALRYVQVLKPRMVIPHHQDDFFPPISTYVDIRPFIKAVTRTCPETKIRIPQINKTMTV
ncbi:MAG: MBL fold metallo-hydrolase [Deltaproteobacteria bacterium]|nr:MBL fold metallo-hydrolase [Deltaproteobacteria bacterium]